MRSFAQRFSKSLAGYSASWTCVVPLLMAGCFFLGCSKSETQQPAKSSTSGGNPVTAPVDYLGAVAQGQKKSISTIDQAGITQAINMFQAAEGRYPKDLNELVGPDYLPRLPTPPPGMKFDYNPTTGQFKVVPK